MFPIALLSLHCIYNHELVLRTDMALEKFRLSAIKGLNLAFLIYGEN